MHFRGYTFRCKMRNAHGILQLRCAPECIIQADMFQRGLGARVPQTITQITVCDITHFNLNYYRRS